MESRPGPRQQFSMSIVRYHLPQPGDICSLRSRHLPRCFVNVSCCPRRLMSSLCLPDKNLDSWGKPGVGCLRFRLHCMAMPTKTLGLLTGNLRWRGVSLRAVNTLVHVQGSPLFILQALHRHHKSSESHKFHCTPQVYRHNSR